MENKIEQNNMEELTFNMKPPHVAHGSARSRVNC
jgi:hypothetical protein